MTGVLDDALGFPYAAGNEDITEPEEVCANKFLMLALLCFAAVYIPVQEKMPNHILWCSLSNYTLFCVLMKGKQTLVPILF